VNLGGLFQPILSRIELRGVLLLADLLGRNLHESYGVQGEDPQPLASASLSRLTPYRR
jgi:hypothetical protein